MSDHPYEKYLRDKAAAYHVALLSLKNKHRSEFFTYYEKELARRNVVVRQNYWKEEFAMEKVRGKLIEAAIRWRLRRRFQRILLREYPELTPGTEVFIEGIILSRRRAR